MTTQTKTVEDYLIPPPNSFWRWGEEGKVVMWVDGPTIAFREELAIILTELSPGGLPDLSSLLLLIAATRDGWDAHRSAIETLRKELALPIELVDGLAAIQKIEKLHRSRPEAKAFLASVVFELNRDFVSPELAGRIARQVYEPLPETIFAPVGARASGSTELLTAFSLSSLLEGLPRLAHVDLLLRKETGLDAVPDQAEAELPPSVLVRTLLKDLRNDPELAAIAKAASQLLATVSIPRPVSQVEEMPSGGVSDIINRGSLDRLLISELAHDDLTLAVRVAVNEALYLRRESSPNLPPQHRIMLLEAGLRTWGLPRVFAISVALALAATPQKEAAVSAFRAAGDRIEPVDLTTRDGIIDQLKTLQPELHPGNSLAAFYKLLEEADGIEPVLIIGEEAFADSDFQRLLSEHVPAPFFIATVSREGRFRLLERTARGTKPLKEVHLNIDDLFIESEQPAVNLVDREWAGDLPVIFSVEPFPLLLSHVIDPQKVWGVAGCGMFSIPRDQRLMLCEDRSKGARQIANNVPHGHLWWAAHELLDGVAVAVVGKLSKQGMHLLRIEPETNTVETKPLNIPQGAKEICGRHGILFAIYASKAVAVSQVSGEVMASLDFPFQIDISYSWFLRDAKSKLWFALAFNGQELSFEHASFNKPADIIAVFDTQDFPMGLTKYGVLVTDSEVIGSDQPLRHVSYAGTSPSGDRVAFVAENIRYEVSTVASSQRQVRPQPSWIHGMIGTHSQSRNLRHRFTHIGVSDSGQLMLVSRKGDKLYFDCPQINQVYLIRGIANQKLRLKQSFKQVKTPCGYSLTRATWDDGSEAFLDSRGLLHLKSSDRSIPEVTMVLHEEGPTAGWSSNGRYWGNSYFIGDHQPEVPALENHLATITAFTKKLS